ncbi:kinase-like domain-containing protein [Leucosporidium creatinivorum]|uniref:non-specific serine/threonine protein kinase n=1 Tax=Leucosporidium creatinivorum TaxID=106004 RepID=A0A1Y2F1D7_9BASI|nr:kinase-like domain-containing protein [Leucosporidium creatinivorum]
MAATFDQLKDQLRDAFYALTGCCCHTDATLKLNGRAFKIIKLLGEGGFSYVYLAQDVASGRHFALKKIRCPLGSDSVRTALKEVEAYKRFRHPNIIRCLDSCVVQDKDEDGKVIYLFLPYYKNGTVQHIISANAVNGTTYPELSILQIFHGTLLAVRAMHTYVPSASSGRRAAPTPGAGGSYPPPEGSSLDLASGGSEGRGGIRSEGETTEEEQDEEESVMRGEGEGEALIGGLEGALAEAEESGGVAGMGEDGGVVMGRLGAGKGKEAERVKDGEMVPWAHRDIKPANIMLSDSNLPILMDFGSALPARIEIPNRQAALMQQDLAAEHCSMPYRAPELFDVKTGTPLTEAVDIWSLGATLFAMAYGTSPFETTQQSEHGGSIAMAAMSGKYKFPEEDKGYSEGFRELIRNMLRVKPEERPKVQEVIEATEKALARLQ